MAGWPGLPNNEFHETWEKRVFFGIQLWLLAPLSLKFALAKAGVLNGGYPLIRSVTPLAEWDTSPFDTEDDGGTRRIKEEDIAEPVR